MNKGKEILKRDEKVIGDVARLRFYPMVAESASGVYVTDVDGKKYLDFNAGWAVANIFYGHSAVAEAVKKTAGKNVFCFPLLYSNRG